jgi:hypothetical protein
MSARTSNRAHPLSEWTEEDGDVLWWKFPIEEAPYVGSPACLGHTVEVWTQDAPEPRVVMRGTVGGWPGYHTHWTRLPTRPARPRPPAAIKAALAQQKGK